MASNVDHPQSTLPYPPIYKDAPVVVLSDWDGTITNRDSNDYMTDNLGFGEKQRRQLNIDILEGRVTYRDAFKKMLDSVETPFEECKELLKKNIILDPGFKEFYEWCRSNDVPIIIVSSGMAPLIRAVLSNLIGEEAAKTIDIIANEAEVKPDGKWELKFRHPSSGYGHDKSQAILPYRDLAHRPTLFFFGDGVSDISAAKHADILFVKNDKPKGENDLAAFVVREQIPHILFTNFKQALPIVQSVVSKEKTVAQVLSEPK